ncbi:MAG: phosphate ABC transporter permease PstC, partial [Brachymonas sp.]|nr:phosphate ABC transporter permease PstC [Brachymonas sp.]
MPTAAPPPHEVAAKETQQKQPGPAPARRTGFLADLIFANAARLATWLTLSLLMGIMLSLIWGAWPAIREFGPAFLVRSAWDPVMEDYGGWVMIYGTLTTSFIALLIAVPVSFGIALFLTEMSPRWLKQPLGTAIELLAAVPSIVYGMWGLMV